MYQLILPRRSTSGEDVRPYHALQRAITKLEMFALHKV